MGTGVGEGWGRQVAALLCALAYSSGATEPEAGLEWQTPAGAWLRHQASPSRGRGGWGEAEVFIIMFLFSKVFPRDTH